MNVPDTNQFDNSKPRRSGILLHPSSLPGLYGIGDFGPEAYRFLDFLAAAGQCLWQVLPLTPTGFGNSPYQSLSSFAGQPLLISPELLLEEQLISAEELASYASKGSTRIDYETVTRQKEQLLLGAYHQYCQHPDPKLKTDYQSFCQEQAYWLDDYSLFMACRARHGNTLWNEWDAPYRNPSAAEKDILHQQLADHIDYYRFVQFLFFRQWQELKQYANKRGIQIIGDLPIFVSLDSADVWANQAYFQLDSSGHPTAVAGVPPDYFAACGQRWGNPLYAWEVHRQEGYHWWIARLKHQFTLFDRLRIDHFRAFEAYWSIPANEPTAVNGTWMPGPGADFFTALRTALGSTLPIIAEDLGLITPAVEALRDQFELPGMKVLQFAFEDRTESTFLPHNFTTTNCVCYTGTHDNNTSCGWYQELPEEAKNRIRLYMNTDAKAIHWDMIRTCLGSIAADAIFPLQDLLGLDAKGRMNTPGVACGNWHWRFEATDLNDGTAAYLKTLSQVYGRNNGGKIK